MVRFECRISFFNSLLGIIWIQARFCSVVVRRLLRVASKTLCVTTYGFTTTRWSTIARITGCAFRLRSLTGRISQRRIPKLEPRSNKSSNARTSCLVAAPKTARYFMTLFESMRTLTWRLILTGSFAPLRRNRRTSRDSVLVRRLRPLSERETLNARARTPPNLRKRFLDSALNSMSAWQTEKFPAHGGSGNKRHSLQSTATAYGRFLRYLKESTLSTLQLHGNWQSLLWTQEPQGPWSQAVFWLLGANDA
jgi:hypothetical protein